MGESAPALGSDLLGSYEPTNVEGSGSARRRRRIVALAVLIVGVGVLVTMLRLLSAG